MKINPHIWLSVTDRTMSGIWQEHGRKQIKVVGMEKYCVNSNVIKKTYMNDFSDPKFSACDHENH